MKCVSRAGAASLSHLCRLLRIYLGRGELVAVAALLIVAACIHCTNSWASLAQRLQALLTVHHKVASSSPSLDKPHWDFKSSSAAAYALQGRRPKMEDRFVIDENIGGSGVSLYAIFDGHGGEFAANYARDNLINSLKQKVVELKKLISKGGLVGGRKALDSCGAVERRASFKKTISVTTEAVKSGGGSGVTDPWLLQKLGELNRPITREVSHNNDPPPPPPDIQSYLDHDCTINYGRLLTDEVLAADRLLVQAAKKTMDVAGTTALIALVEGSRLIVANVGDSRGVMCDAKGNAIPLSFDHKPQQMREQKRIKEAGGFITFNGVWRVAGILATSRALGDYPLKDKKLVIADPDILTFRLDDHRPQFVVLASDGLWDTFTNEEAIAFIRHQLSEEPHLGAKSIALQAYSRGSLDNITVLVVQLSGNRS
ncbi:hypothetical protein AAG570_001541 [Ranatra chinensis]|uniref:PPM-type phosphatase domain-containing protein n=1 Tax=Ranatra chinensis TaxID=642074 RepID=A0ABD0Y8T3_9HEMI